MKKSVIGIAILILFSGLAFSQNAQAVTEILEKGTANYMDFSYLVASELGMDVSPFEAYTYCDRFGIFPYGHRVTDPVSVKTMSHFFMTAYAMKGGILWTATHNARYAWKELRANGFWSQGTDPSMHLSGRDMVRAVSRFFARWPESRLIDPPAVEAPARFRSNLLADKEVK